MSNKRDYYEVLGLAKDASVDDIKRAYRKGALKYHPDNYKGDKAEGEMHFKELAEAYEVLSDSVKRKRYDQYGHAGMAGAGVHDFTNMGFGDIFSMFEDIFGGGGFGGQRRRTAAQSRGYDLETQVTMTLEQVLTGADQTLEFERMDLCESCNGSGAKKGSQPQKCATCGGYGQVQQQVSGFFGMSVRITDCPDCKGKGTIIADPCSSCKGSGRQRKKRVLSIHVPPGIHDGQVVRVRGEGEPGPDGTNRGDLHCYVRIERHPFLQRNNNDLICQVPIPFSLAALGGTTSVPVLGGTEEIEIPSGTQHGQTVTIKGKGLPTPRSQRRGDQYVQVLIEVPRKLNDKQKSLLKELAAMDEVNITPERKSFLDKLKDFIK